MLSPAGLGQTIAVVDQSGKVVSTSKHLFSVFKEAKAAYRERKAEIVQLRKIKAEKEYHQKPGRAYTINDDDRSSTRSRARHSPREGEHHHSRPHTTRRRSSASVRSGSIYPASEARYERDIISPRSPHSPSEAPYSPSQMSPRHSPAELSRRHTSRDIAAPVSPKSPTRSRSADDIDMHLAYGEMPPDLTVARREDEEELQGLVGRVKGLLDEADCLQHSVTATITNLQKNPEAMAAVALTLAEISNLAKKMAPGALMSIRTAAPTVFALLASPQFLIAAGVGVGITIVAFGGYKIVKKIQAKKAEENAMEEMLEIGADVSRIETWRQGIAEVEARSLGTSVEGEFITPMAHNLSRLNLEEDQREMRREKSRSGRTAKSTTSKTSKTSKSSKSSKSPKDKKEKDRKEKKDKKSAKPSPLRLMFTP